MFNVCTAFVDIAFDLYDYRDGPTLHIEMTEQWSLTYHTGFLRGRRKLYLHLWTVGAIVHIAQQHSTSTETQQTMLVFFAMMFPRMPLKIALLG